MNSIFQDPQTGDWYQGPDRSGSPFGDDDEERLRSQGIVRDPHSGDFYQVPQSSIPNWRKPEPVMAPQAPADPTLEDGVGVADYAKSVMAGGAQIGQAAGWLIKQLGAEDVGGAIETLGRDAVDYWNEGLSDAAKDALSREFVRKNEAGEYEWGDANLHTVGLFGAQSLLGTMAGAGAGAGITKVLQTFANPVGRSALLQAVQAGTRAEQALAAGTAGAESTSLAQAAARGSQALKKLALVDKVIGAAGFGAGEGLIGGASAGVNVYDRIMTMDPAKIMENQRYRQVYESTDDSMPELERHQYAAETVAREASSLAGLQSGLTTALLGGPMGAYFGSVFGKSAVGKLVQSRAARAATGAAGEGAQEFAQGAAEQAIGNVAVRDAGDTDVDVWDDVLNQALGGALAGAPIGGVLGAAESEPLPSTPTMEEMKAKFPPPQQQLALPAPRAEADFTVGPGGEAIPRGQTRPEQLALPAPQAANAFEVGNNGEARQLTEAEAFQADQRRTEATAVDEQQRTELGTMPTKVPGETGKAWGKDTTERLKTTATEAVQAGASRETVLGIVRSAAKGETPPLVAMRQIRQVQTEVEASRKPKALAAPRPANAFEVSKTGETRQLTEAEARQAGEKVAAAAQAKTDMGTAPTKAPGLGGKRGQIATRAWKEQSLQRVEAAAESAIKAGVPKEVADGVLTRLDKGEVVPLVAARQLKQLERAQIQTTEAPPQKQEEEVKATAVETVGEAPIEVPRGTSEQPVDKPGKPLLSRSAPETIEFRDVSDFDKWVKTNADDGTEQLKGSGVGEIELAPATKTTGLRGAKYDQPADVKNVYRTRDGRLFYWQLSESSGSRNPGKAVEINADDPRVKLTAKPLLSRASGKQTHQRIGLLPRDIREDLFNQHAVFNDPDAKQTDFNLKKVPRRRLRIDNIEGLDAISPAELEKYGDPTKLPPLVIADGRLIDGQHRIGQAKRMGITELDAIDVTGLIDTEESGYITELPERQEAAPAAEETPEQMLAEADQLLTGIRARSKADRDAGLDEVSEETFRANRADNLRASELKTRAAELRNTPKREESAPLKRQGPVAEAVRAATGRVREELKDFTAGINSLVNVRIWETAADMQAAVGMEIPADTKGAWWPGSSTVHIIAENNGPGEAVRTAVHETFGHLAMERYPEGQRAIDSVTRQIGQGAEWTRPYVKAVQGTHGNLTDQELAKEVIALMAERGEKNLTMIKLIAGIRRFLRKLGVNIDYSDADIRDLIVRSARALKQEAIQARPKLAALTPASTDQQILDAIEEQFPTTVIALDSYMALRSAREKATGDTAAELDAEIAALEGAKPEGGSTLRLKKPLRSAEPTIELDRVRYPIRDDNGKLLAETPEQQRNFWRWFRGSKAVDAKGRPRPVYHGTGAKFTSFKKSKSTQGIFWVTTDRSAIEKGEVGAQGKGQVLDLYASIKNPAGWEEYHKYGLGELKRNGYDGAILPEKDGTFVAFVFESSQLKSATRNRGTFDPGNPNILFRRGKAQASPDVQEILDRVMVKPPESMTMRDRARELWHKITDTSSLELKQGFVDSFASIEALERAANDGSLKDAAESAYKAALATKNLSSVMAGVMLKGVPQFTNGAYQPVPGRKGIVDIFDPLTKHKDGNLLSQWEGYAAARRASRLIKEKNADGSNRENLFTQAEIDTLLTLGKKYPEFDRVFDEWQTFNKQTLDLAQEAGVVDPETRVLWERNDYVPFYRAAEELGGKTGPSNKAGLANQSSGIRQLKGGEAMLGNVFENMMMNTAHLIDASFKNQAMQRIVELGTGTAMEKVDLDWEAVKFNDAQLAGALRKAGIEVDSMDKAQREHWSTLFRRIAPKGPGIVSVMKNGKPEYYEVTDPLVLQSIAGLGYDNFADVFGLFRGSKKLLTNAITADPAFMMANFVRDTLSNWVISDASTKPMVDAVKALGATLRDDPDLVQLMMAGAGGGGFYDSAPEDIRKLIASRVPANQQKAFLDSVVGPKNVWRLWRKIGAATENANRIATFRAVLAAGGSVAEAAYQARDVLNFSMAGDFGAMRWMVQSVPFLNARVQGLYRLYRGARDNKKAFFTKGLMLTAATMALALSNEDDDRYEELPEWDKDTYWHLFLGDEHWRIPKPFEIGALFSTIPERVYRTAAGRDSAKILTDRMAQMVMDTFAFNPVPQLVKPIIEQYANRSMFTGSPIVGMAEQPLQPEAQFTPWTSETMQELAKAMPDFAPAWLRSPKRLEAALRAYTGAIGMYVLSASDQVVRTAMGYPPEPGRKIYDLPVVSRFWKDPDPRHTKYADELYEMMDEANAISSTVNRYTRERRFDEAAELRTANKDKLAVRVRLNRLGTQVRNINNQIRLIQLDENMDPGTKRTRIDALVDRKNDTTREVARYADIF